MGAFFFAYVQVCCLFFFLFFFFIKKKRWVWFYWWWFIYLFLSNVHLCMIGKKWYCMVFDGVGMFFEEHDSPIGNQWLKNIAIPMPCKNLGSPVNGLELWGGGIYVGLGRYITMLAFLACRFFCSKMLKHNKFHKLVECSGCDLCNITFIRTAIDITFIIDQLNLPPLELWKNV